MSQRAQQLHSSAEEQVGTLIELLSTVKEETLRQPCPGRRKLGDGTIGAIAAHTAQNYQRIVTFVTTSEGMSSRHGHGLRRQHRTPGLLRALLPTPPGHNQAGHDGHQDEFTVDGADRTAIVERLVGVRAELARIAQLTDDELDSVPPKDSFRFCDGERTLEQVLSGLLKHQDHQVQALAAALAPA